MVLTFVGKIPRHLEEAATASSSGERDGGVKERPGDHFDADLDREVGK